MYPQKTFLIEQISEYKPVIFQSCDVTTLYQKLEALITTVNKVICGHGIGEKTLLKYQTQPGIDVRRVSRIFDEASEGGVDESRIDDDVKGTGLNL